MTIIEFRFSTLFLLDVRRRSWYAALTLFGLTVWTEWFPRPIAGKRFLTFGAR